MIPHARRTTAYAHGILPVKNISHAGYRRNWSASPWRTDSNYTITPVSR